MKICKICGTEKPLSFFGKSGNRYDTRCLSCRRNQYRQNRESILADKKRHYRENWAQYSAKNKNWHEKNKDFHKQRMRVYRSDNREYLREKDRQYYAANCDAKKQTNKLWREQNQEALRKMWVDYRNRNRGRILANCAARRAQKIKATPAWAKLKQIRQLYELREMLPDYHVDHIVPLNSPIVCGLHVENNLQLLPAKENLMKSNRFWPDMP